MANITEPLSPLAHFLLACLCLASGKNTKDKGAWMQWGR